MQYNVHNVNHNMSKISVHKLSVNRQCDNCEYIFRTSRSVLFLASFFTAHAHKLLGYFAASCQNRC